MLQANAPFFVISM